MVSRSDFGGRALGFFGFLTLLVCENQPELGADACDFLPDIHGGRDIRGWFCPVVVGCQKKMPVKVVDWFPGGDEVGNFKVVMTCTAVQHG